jgi:tRNA threonylcarbamoyladenosine biosynthesis protein TsaE
MDSEVYITNSEDETIKLGSGFAEKLIPGDVVAIFGELGSGKTEFIKGVCKHFNVDEIVTSPTFTIMNQYRGITEQGEDVDIYHIDLYRIESAKELDEVGFKECVYQPGSIKLIEWPEHSYEALPDHRYNVRIKSSEEEEEKRTFYISHTNSKPSSPFE